MNTAVAMPTMIMFTAKVARSVDNPVDSYSVDQDTQQQPADGHQDQIGIQTQSGAAQVDAEHPEGNDRPM